MAKERKPLLNEVRVCPGCKAEIQILAYKKTVSPAVPAETELELTLELTKQMTFEEREDKRDKKRRRSKKKQKG